MSLLNSSLKEAAKALKKSKYAIAFTGAGISVESGIPPFRGPTGLWSQYDPNVLDINRFINSPEESWPVIKKIFYDFWAEAQPNLAHFGLASLQKHHIINDIITQNIDILHQKAGSTDVWEFHGTLKTLTCVNCGYQLEWSPEQFTNEVPLCPQCQGLLKPDFVFFGENIPDSAQINSNRAIEKADVLLIIGTTGEIMPASYLPIIAARNGATIIEINPQRSKFTESITNIFLQEKAGVVLPKLLEIMKISEDKNELRTIF